MMLDNLKEINLAKGVNFIGPILAVAVYIMIGFNVYMYFDWFLPILYASRIWYLPLSSPDSNILGISQSLIVTILFCWLVFNILFNYSLAMMVSPGKLEEFYEAKSKNVSILLKILDLMLIEKKIMN